MNILLLDDDAITHEITATFLNHYGKENDTHITIKALHDPVHGLLELLDHGAEYDVILLDVRLPKISGDEIYRSIVRNMPQLLGRVVFITASPAELQTKLPDQKLRVLGKPFRYLLLAQHLSDIGLRPSAKQTAGQFNI